MKYFYALLSIALILIPATARSQGTWLVRTEDPQKAQSLADRAGLELVRRYNHLSWAVYRSNPAVGIKLSASAAARLFAEAAVPFEPDRPVHLAAVPGDAQFSSQTYFNSPLADADIHIQQAWDVRTGSGNIVVAVIDSGIDTDHPDLPPNVWVNTAELQGVAGVDDDGNGRIDDFRGWNFVDDNNNTEDTVGHGTQVAGVVGAVGDNGIGIAGVCWDARLMILRAFEDQTTSTSILLEAIDYVLDFPQVRVVNASWGDTEVNLPLQDAVEILEQNDILFVAAAGNDGDDLDLIPYYPASLPFSNIVSVAAVGASGSLSGFSNFGSQVSVAAPGSGLFTTQMGGGYGPGSGTSFATPIVSGAAALLFARYPFLTASQVRQQIIDNSRDTAALASADLLGGLLDVQAMLNVFYPNDVPTDAWQLYP